MIFRNVYIRERETMTRGTFQSERIPIVMDEYLIATNKKRTVYGLTIRIYDRHPFLIEPGVQREVSQMRCAGSILPSPIKHKAAADPLRASGRLSATSPTNLFVCKNQRSNNRINISRKHIGACAKRNCPTESTVRISEFLQQPTSARQIIAESAVVLRHP